MSGDETFVMAVCALIALAAWITWYSSVATATTLGTTHHQRLGLYLVPLLCAVALFVILRLFASYDVRDSATYLAFYLVMGAAWVGVARAALPAMGLHPRDDAVERRNPAAGVAVIGALIGITFAFAGGNIGNGPGWWVVVFSAILSTGGLLLVWGMVQKFTRIADAITIDRDVASAVRLAGFLVAGGLILGRAVAGDWVSFDATVRDFLYIGWPVLPLVVAEIFLSRLFRPTPQHPSWPIVPHGVLPALVYISAAIVYVTGVGRW